MKKINFKKWVMCIVSVFMCACLMACSSSANDKEDKKEDKNKTYAVGDTVELKKQKFTVNGIRTLDQDKSGYQKPEDGKEFLLVSCTIENTSDEDINVSSMLLFKVADKDGQECKQAIFTDTEGNLDGTVLPGKKIKGEYVVQAPKGATDLELQYTTDAIGGENVLVKLN